MNEMTAVNAIGQDSGAARPAFTLPFIIEPYSREISPQDTMNAPGGERYYFGTGLSALQCIVSILAARAGQPGGAQSPENILDFGCGFGRVARYLRAAFCDASIDVTDIDHAGVEFCASKLACNAIDKLPAAAKYDLIWVGSVFTHLPPVASKRLLHQLKASLRPNGVLIITSQGRFSFERSKTNDPHANYRISRDLIEQITRDYAVYDYGFANYAKQTDYGVAIAKPQWFAEHVCDSNCFQIGLLERGWDCHQDVLAFIRKPLLEAMKPAFYNVGKP